MLSEQDLKLAKCTYTFWDKLTPEQQDFLWENLYPVSYQKGDIIHNGEYSCIGVVLIKTGGLRVFMLSSEGKEITLYRAGAPGGLHPVRLLHSAEHHLRCLRGGRIGY